MDFGEAFGVTTSRNALYVVPPNPERNGSSESVVRNPATRPSYDEHIHLAPYPTSSAPPGGALDAHRYDERSASETHLGRRQWSWSLEKHLSSNNVFGPLLHVSPSFRPSYEVATPCFLYLFLHLFCIMYKLHFYANAWLRGWQVFINFADLQQNRTEHRA